MKKINIKWIKATCRLLVLAGACCVSVGAQAMERQKPSLLETVKRGDLKEVSRLIELGADIRERSKYTDVTVLHLAVLHDHFELVPVLLRAGAEIDGKSDLGETVLHLACEKNNVELVKVLLRAGASLNEKNTIGQTPLHLAFEKNNVALVRVVLKEGAHPNEKDVLGCTPLHCAALKGFVDVMKELVKWGADKDMKVEAVKPTNKIYYGMTAANILKKITPRGIVDFEMKKSREEKHKEFVGWCRWYEGSERRNEGHKQRLELVAERCDVLSKGVFFV